MVHAINGGKGFERVIGRWIVLLLWLKVRGVGVGFRNDTRLYPSSARKEEKVIITAVGCGIEFTFENHIFKKIIKNKNNNYKSNIIKK